jgi:hypothetical protein
VKGPLAAPERTIDVSTLVAWLSMRAAELQTRRLESLEANRRQEVLGAVVRPGSPPIRVVPLGTALESAVQSAPSGPTLGTRAFEHLLPETPPAPPVVNRPETGSIDHGATAAAAVPSPPGVKPAPANTPPRTSSAPAQAAPTTLNSLLKYLFGSQN